jgi:EKC/KEOPS complex subunit CGI121/TPRKB
VAAVQTHLISNIKGKQVPFTDEQLCEITDWKKIRKIYKLPPTLSLCAESKGNGAINSDTEIDKPREAEILILGAMALRGAA